MITKRLQSTNLFESHELALVSALVAWDFPIIAIDRSDSKKVSFVFSKNEALTQAVESFWNDTGTVSPKKYFNTLRECKSRIYGG